MMSTGMNQPLVRLRKFNGEKYRYQMRTGSHLPMKFASRSYKRGFEKNQVNGDRD